MKINITWKLRTKLVNKSISLLLTSKTLIQPVETEMETDLGMEMEMMTVRMNLHLD